MNTMNSLEKDTSLIPIGHYCYHLDNSYDGPKIEEYSFPIVSCPYDSYKNINGVNVPYCAYLEKSGCKNGWKDGEFEKLIEYFGSEDAVYDNLPLDLLWDSCKECGENYEEDFGLSYDELETIDGQEKYNKIVNDWINKVKKLKYGK